MVDPDNRRPVDFGLRAEMLRDVRERFAREGAVCAEHLLDAPEDGGVKMFLIHRILEARKQWREVFDQGSYTALQTEGRFKTQILAFCRYHQNRWLLAVAPRLFASVVEESQLPLRDEVWQDTACILPRGAPHQWENRLTGETFELQEGRLLLGTLLRHLPVGLATGK
jgi:(1->4)-alpha-D-glucan 1-alpha-D-glucosylmutase